jgi:hypothetical protein
MFAVAPFLPGNPLPVPQIVTAPIVVSGAQVGLEPTVTPAVWVAIPGAPAGMAREVETRLTVNGTLASVPLGTGAAGGALRAEARARHTLPGKTGRWSAWFASAPVTVTGAPQLAFSDPGNNTRILNYTALTPITFGVTDGAFPQRTGQDITDPAAFADGPVFLFNGLIGVGGTAGETPDVGDTVRLAAPPLLAWDFAVAEPVLEYQWVRSGTIEISGATGTELLVPSIAGQELVLEITATDANGSRTARTNVLTVSGAATLSVEGQVSGILTSGTVSATVSGILVE